MVLSFFLFFFGLRYEVQGHEKEINIWFSNAIGRPCTLLRCFSSKYNLGLNSKSTDMCRRMESKLNFSNEAQFLLVSEESVADLHNRLKTSMFSFIVFQSYNESNITVLMMNMCVDDIGSSPLVYANAIQDPP